MERVRGKIMIEVGELPNPMIAPLPMSAQSADIWACSDYCAGSLPEDLSGDLSTRIGAVSIRVGTFIATWIKEESKGACRHSRYARMDTVKWVVDALTT